LLHPAVSEKDLVIITGSSGFIGARLVHRLAGRYALAGFDKIAARTRRRRPNASAST
jgi:nucleoside-diphosphate-sugar epimerase